MNYRYYFKATDGSIVLYAKDINVAECDRLYNEQQAGESRFATDDGTELVLHREPLN